MSEGGYLIPPEFGLQVIQAPSFFELMLQTPEGQFLWDRMEMDADTELLRMARHTGMGLIEARELDDKLAAAEDHAFLYGSPT
jgi:hypothetical protein